MAIRTEGQLLAAGMERISPSTQRFQYWTGATADGTVYDLAWDRDTHRTWRRRHDVSMEQFLVDVSQSTIMVQLILQLLPDTPARAAVIQDLTATLVEE